MVVVVVVVMIVVAVVAAVVVLVVMVVVVVLVVMLTCGSSCQLVYGSSTPRAAALAGRLNYVSDPTWTRNVSPLTVLVHTSVGGGGGRSRLLGQRLESKRWQGLVLGFIVYRGSIGKRP
ncbi:hypothetical protein ElyMa_004213600 [Elysia marginata]|uniref:Secreted protein n=1 Tax=Elysia marginata TaxID=1093978 RepID=A0AAV4GMS3_9GAST|nr:hypothetical protein ElyMa_004213600 [Elysia marginata]